MLVKRFRKIALMLPLLGAMVVSCGGCMGFSPDQPASSAVPQSSVGTEEPSVHATATLDWTTATIHLPLDAYGMDQQGMQTVMAAQEIVWARCALKTDAVTTQVLASAKSILAGPAPQTHWLFGIWDADYVASQGWGPEAMEVDTVPDGIQVDPDSGKACVNTDEYQELDAITRMNYPDDPSYEALFVYADEANEKTVGSQAFSALLAQKAQCIESKGYSVSTYSELAGIDMPDDWTSEQMLAAALAEAQCSDSLGYTQQAADINASYEQEYINAHQAELVEVKKLADERVAKATQILRDVGVM